MVVGYHLYDFGLPSVNGDETSTALLALSMITTPGSDLYNYSFTHGFHVGIFPISFQPYVGGLSSYLQAPILYFFGYNLTSIRGYEMLTTVLIVVLTYFTGKEIFSRRVGMISASLLLVLPTFIFYSRQSVTYEWILLSIALLIIIFGFRYLKTLKIRYLFGSLALIGIGVWGYAWFLWFVLGLIVTVPIVIKAINYKLNNQAMNGEQLAVIHIRHNRMRFWTISLLSLLLGFTPLILQYLFQPPQGSLVPFLLRIIAGEETGYLGLGSNTNILENLAMRGDHLFAILGRLGVGFSFSSIKFLDLYEGTYTFPLLFIATTIISIGYVIYKQPKSKRVAGVLLLIFTMFIASPFTVSEFNPWQLGIMLPFVILSMGKGIEIIASNKKVLNLFTSFGRKISSNHIILSVMIVVIILQIPIVIEGYAMMESASTAHANVPYERLNSYLKENNLQPVSLGWWTTRLLPVYTNGEQVPKIVSLPREFNDETKQSMVPMESLGLLSNQYLFTVYVFPEIPKCSQYPVSTEYVCSQIYFVESAANRNNKKVEIVDFPLPDGTPYLRTLRFID